MIEFHETVLGHRFFNNTMPNVVKEIARLADQVGVLVDILKDKPHFLFAFRF